MTDLFPIYHPEIPEFLLQAAKTPAMKRLKGVGMNCGCEYTSFPLFSNVAPYSRFDHSMGVALIIWHFTGSKIQTLAGLFHDIATPVFAHVVDFLNGDHITQETTEADTAQHIRADNDIALLLNRWEIPSEQVEDYHQYPIADNDSPMLSADRLEYTLGNAINYHILSRGEAESLYRDLTVGENEWGQPELMFQTPSCALAFSEAALQCSRIYVSDPDRYAMQILAELLGNAIQSDLITKADLHRTEPEIIRKLENSSLSEQWRRFRSFREIVRSDAPTPDGQWRRISAKKRYINPFIVDTGRTADVFPALSAELEEFKNSRQNIWLCGK